MNATDLIPHAINATLLGLVFGFLKRELNDIRARIMRIENTYFKE